MELLKFKRRKSKISDLVYLALNIGMAIAVLVVVLAVDSPWLAFLIVLVSKWRIFAVRPRFWRANILANLVDLIVSVSVVVLLYAAMGAFWLQLLITLLYIVWLLFIKPRSSRRAVVIQAGAAMFLGVTALFTVGYEWDVFFIVLGMWIIGFSTARHVLTSYDEPLSDLFSIMSGLVLAELGWIAYHWTFAYVLPGFANVKLVQVAMVATLIGFIAQQSYDYFIREGHKKRSDWIIPIVFSVLTIILLLTIFNSLDGGKGGL